VSFFAYCFIVLSLSHLSYTWRDNLQIQYNIHIYTYLFILKPHQLLAHFVSSCTWHLRCEWFEGRSTRLHLETRRGLDSNLEKLASSQVHHPIKTYSYMYIDIVFFSYIYIYIFSPCNKRESKKKIFETSLINHPYSHTS
jgi:hypothetical protein